MMKKKLPCILTTPKWTTLDSSNTKRCCYFRKTKMLLIEFPNESVYVYSPVSWSTYMKFRRADSHGSYFSSAIRNNPKIYYMQVI